MQTPPSPLETLRQLKEMLDAGALTQAEFDTLKQRLVFADAAPAAPTPAPAPAPLPLPPLPISEAPVAPLPFPTAPEPPMPAATSFLPPPAPWAEPAAEPEFEPKYASEFEPESEAAWTESEFAAPAAPPTHNPLALILSIGGLLALLGLVLYLSLNRHPSEHISSTSQTAADSVRAAIETGPQAPLLPAAAAPETVRVAPAHPAAPVVPRPAAPAPDSVVVPAAPPGAPVDSAAKP